MRFLAVLSYMSLLALPAVSHADSIQTFTLDSKLTDGIVAYGTVDLNTTKGAVLNSNIFTKTIGNLYSFNVFTAVFDHGNVQTIELSDGGQDRFYITIPVATLVGYTGGHVCADDLADACAVSGPGSAYYVTGLDSFNEGVIGATTGTFAPTAPAATPEPATLTLLASGVIALCGLRRLGAG